MHRPIEVLYGCDFCGLYGRAVPMRRWVEAEDIRHWLDEVGREVAYDHRLCSPYCVSRGVTYVEIPEAVLKR